MGALTQIWKLFEEPEGGYYPDLPTPTYYPPYTPYSFVSATRGIPKMSINRDFARRESIVSVPSLDSVLDQYGRMPGPTEKREMPFGFTVFTNGDNDAAYDLLAAQVAPGEPVRLQYTTDSGAQWYTIGSNARIQNTNASENKWGAGGEVNFVVTWRIRPDWRPRYSEASDIWGINDGVWGTNDGTWGQGFTVPLTAASTTFTLDATGVAGSTLPTIPDTGPVVNITGGSTGFGGAGGILLVNGSARDWDTTGKKQPVSVILPKVPINGALIADFGAGKFTLSSGASTVSFRPVKNLWQKDFMRVDPGKVNGFSATALGASPIYGAASILVDWWRKRA